MPALSSASPSEPSPVANLSPKSHVLSSPLAIFLMRVSTELPDWSIALENSLMLAFASCADWANPTSNAPATVKAMPHGPPKAANSPLPMLFMPFIAVWPRVSPLASVPALVDVPSMEVPSWMMPSLSSGMAVMPRWNGSSIRPKFRAVCELLAFNGPMAECRAVKPPASAVISTMPCCTGAGSWLNASTKVSSDCTRERNGP